VIVIRRLEIFLNIFCITLLSVLMRVI